MKQQINLLLVLPKEHGILLPFKQICRIWGGVLALLLVIWGYQMWSAMSMSTQLTLLEQQVSQQKEMVLNLAKTKKQADPVSSQVQLDALTKEVAAREQIVDLLSATSQQVQKGFSPFFMAIAESVPNGVWLTHIQITQQGKMVRLEGNGLTNGDVLSFVDRLKTNAVFSSMNVRLDSLTQVSFPASKEGTAPSQGFSFVVVTSNE